MSRSTRRRPFPRRTFRARPITLDVRYSLDDAAIVNQLRQAIAGDDLERLQVLVNMLPLTADLLDVSEVKRRSPRS